MAAAAGMGIWLSGARLEPDMPAGQAERVDMDRSQTRLRAPRPVGPAPLSASKRAEAADRVILDRLEDGATVLQVAPPDGRAGSNPRALVVLPPDLDPGQIQIRAVDGVAEVTWPLVVEWLPAQTLLVPPALADEPLQVDEVHGLVSRLNPVAIDESSDAVTHVSPIPVDERAMALDGVVTGSPGQWMDARDVAAVPYLSAPPMQPMPVAGSHDNDGLVVIPQPR